MFTIWQKPHFFNRPPQVVSTCTKYRTSRGISCTGYKSVSPIKTDQDRLSDKETTRKAYVQADSRQYHAKKADTIEEASQGYYTANEKFVLYKQRHYDPKTGRTLETRSRANQRNEANQLAINDEVERKSRAERKAESERRQAEKKAEHEQRHTEERVERQRGLAQKKAMLDDGQRVKCRAASTEADRELLRQKAVEYRRNPDVRKKQVNIEQQRRAIDNNYARRVDMRVWLLRCSQPQAFAWKTHVPIIYPRKEVKTCSACGKTRHAGARLWWKKLGLYECHTCYTADVSRAMPRGFENFVFGNGRNPRP